MSSDSDDRLRAVTFDPKPSIDSAPDTSPETGSHGVWIAGAIGVVLLAFVVLFLPSLAPAPTAEPFPQSLNSTDTAASQTAQSVTSETKERSPFAEAQLAKARRAAQEALQKLLETQSRLEARAVNAWAEAEFTAATAIAVEGDVFYREQNFDEAEATYRVAQSALEVIEAQLSDEVVARLETLLAAIEASDAESAASVSQTLSQMAPDNADVAATVDRVPVIPEVAALIERADTLFGQRSFSEALEQVQAAQALDPAHKRLQALAEDYQRALTDDRFQQAMTRGFEALEVGDFKSAKAAFSSAAALKPSDNSPSIALDQAEEAEILSTLNRYVSNAEQQESSEDWEAAATSYADALALDPSLVQATEGLARAEPMADLFSRLSNIVDKSARLVDPTILGDAQATVEQANGVLGDLSDRKSAMPKLTALWSEALKVVENASTPLPVMMTSDGVTEIIIKRVARLGTLTSRTVSLRPGQYQLLGSRVGFRDVLVTLNVGVDRENSIDIRCTEAIGG